MLLSCATPENVKGALMIHCHLDRFMHRDHLTVSEVARRAGLNRSTVTALARQAATRVELPAVERLCDLFGCGVGELFERVPGHEGPRS